MLTRSKASASKDAAAPSSLSAPLSSAAAASRAQSSLSADAHANTQASMHDQTLEAKNADDAANAAGASQPPSAPAAAHSLTGRKRAADTQTDAAAQTEDDGSAPHSLTHAVSGDSSTCAESKKHRAESTRHSRSAFSAGFEAKDDGPTSAAAASASNGHNSSADVMADVPPSSGDKSESKQDSTSAGSCACSASAVASADESRAIAARAEADRIFAAAVALIPIALPVAEADSARYNTLHAHSVDRFHFQAVIRQARACMDQPASVASMAPVGRLVNSIVDLGASLTREAADATNPAPLRDELLRVDELYTQLAAVVPDLSLTTEQSEALVRSSFHAGALQLIPVLMRHSSVSGISVWTSRGDPALSYFCRYSGGHAMSHQPFLRLFEYGLDPTQVNPDDRKRISALHIVREFVRDHPPVASDASAASAAAASSAAEAAASMVDEQTGNDAIPSVLAAYAMHQQLAEDNAETQRRKELHARFMHALLPAWLSHSNAVLGLLSSPSVLIPDLAAIVGRYLALEGLPADPAESVDDEGAQIEAEQ